MSGIVDKPDRPAVTNEELAYIAGFFDGEGSVTITKTLTAARSRAWNHTLQVHIGNIDPRVLIWIQSLFGGGIHYRKQASPRHRNYAEWFVRSRGALAFLEAIRPFLRMKRDQVDVAIAYQRTRFRHGPTPVSAETIAWRETQKETISQLNGREWVH